MDEFLLILYTHIYIICVESAKFLTRSWVVNKMIKLSIESLTFFFILILFGIVHIFGKIEIFNSPIKLTVLNLKQMSSLMCIFKSDYTGKYMYISFKFNPSLKQSI